MGMRLAGDTYKHEPNQNKTKSTELRIKVREKKNMNEMLTFY